MQTLPILLGEIPALETGQICSVSTANELDTLRIGAISFMVIQPTQKLQEEKAQDLQQMYKPLKMIEASLKKLLRREDKFH